ncbi:MAG: type II secretion system F family protein [Alphaproteobacteria bacterium]|nr:type II secretion system F family protein [Alphaproteobacteria bacterium]
MTMFRYRAMTQAGGLVHGAAELPSEAALIQHLRGQGQYLLSSRQSGTPAGAGSAMARLLHALRPTRRVAPRALAMMTQELASLLEAGLELDHALGILENLADIGALRAPVAAARARVRDGASFGEALAEDDLFPRFYVGMVRAGEQGGGLETTLRRLGDYLERSLAIREAISSALVYPMILMVSAGISIAIILTVVLPEFKPLFAEAGKSLPWPTQVVMDIGDFFRSYWWALAFGTIAGAAWFRQSWQRPVFRRRCDGLLLRLPLLGKLLAAIDVERFERTLGALLSNGVPLPSALALIKDTLWNSVLREAVGDTARSLREGESLASRLAESGIFPAVTLDLIRIGEETGKLDTMLLRQADLDEQRLRHTVDRLLSLLVPALTIVLGLIVGGLIASLLVAILGVNDLALQ